MVPCQPFREHGTMRASAKLLAFLWCVAGCAHTASHTMKVPRPTVDATLGPGDVFDVRVFEEPDLSGTYRIDPEGSIDYPLVGHVEVSGKLPGEIAQLLREKLVAFVHKPSVSVFVREMNSKHVIVYGQVQKPGTFPYVDAMTISQAISLAGGFTAMAARERVMVSKFDKDKQQVIEIDLRSIATGRTPNYFVSPGDEVYVPERMF